MYEYEMEALYDRYHLDALSALYFISAYVKKDRMISLDRLTKDLDTISSNILRYLGMDKEIDFVTNIEPDIFNPYENNDASDLMRSMIDPELWERYRCGDTMADEAEETWACRNLAAGRFKKEISEMSIYDLKRYPGDLINMAKCLDAEPALYKSIGEKDTPWDMQTFLLFSPRMHTDYGEEKIEEIAEDCSDKYCKDAKIRGV